MKRARLQKGSVVLDKRRKTWNFLWCENGHRRTKGPRNNKSPVTSLTCTFPHAG